MAINSNIGNWIDRSELKVDYFIEFIKVWIPFNAWYMHNFYDEDSSPKRNNDSSIIYHLNTTSNTYRDKIISLLRGTNNDSIHFKMLISNLHFELNSISIPNFNERITFETICLSKNPVKTFSLNSGRLTYFVEFKDTLPKTQKRWFLEVQKKHNNQTLHRIELHNFSQQDLSNDLDFIGLPDNNMKIRLKECFDNINPRKPIMIIAPAKQTRAGTFVQPINSIVMDTDRNFYFIEDFDLVSKAIVQLIYELRCKLFHGELNPNNGNMKAYEYAYQIQKILIQELR